MQIGEGYYDYNIEETRKEEVVGLWHDGIT